MSEDQPAAIRPEKGTRRVLRTRHALTALLGIVVAFGAYYFLHIEKRRAFLEEYHLRTLATSAGNVVRSIEGLHRRVELACERDAPHGAVAGQLERIEGLERVGAIPPDSKEDLEEWSVNDDWAPTFSRTADGMTLQYIVELVRPPPEMESAQPLPETKTGADADAEQGERESSVDPGDDPDEPPAPAVAPQELAEELAPIAKDPERVQELPFALSGKLLQRVMARQEEVASARRQLAEAQRTAPAESPRQLPDALASPPADLPRTTVHEIWRADVEALLAPTLPTQVFESLLFADAGGQVYFQSGEQKVRFLELPAGESSLTDDEASAFSMSEVRKVRVAGQSYKLFLHPLRIPMGQPDLEIELNGQVTDSQPELETWVLAGLVPESRMRASSFAISPTLILMVMGLFLAVLVSLPCVKLLSLGDRDPLRTWDVMVIGTSLVVLAAIGALGFVDTWSYLELRAARDAYLKSLAQEVTQSFERELGLMGAELESLSKLRWDPASEGPLSPDAQTGIRRRMRLEHHPFLEMAFWLDREGYQRSIWSVRDSSPRPNKLAHRAYFRRALNRDLWKVPRDPGSGDSDASGRFVQSIISTTMGRSFAILSQHMDELDPHVHVAAIEAAPLSVMDPLLPPGVSFGIVDREGTLLFHSDSSRNLSENLLEELGARDELRATLASGRPEFFDTTYRTETLRAYATPLADIPWTLVVFREKLDLQTMHLDALTFALLCFGAYMLLLLLIGAWLSFTSPRRPPPGAPLRAWYWPTAERFGDYKRLIVALLLLLAQWVFHTWSSTRGPVVVMHSAGTGLLVLVQIQRLLGGRPSGTSAPGQDSGTERTHDLDRQLVSSLPGLLALVVLALAVWLSAAQPKFWMGLPALALFVGLLWLRRADLFHLALLFVVAVPLVQLARLVPDRDPARFLWLCVPLTLFALFWRNGEEPAREPIRRVPWKAAVVAAAALALMILGGVPAVGSYLAVDREQAQLVQKRWQLDFARDLKERASRLMEDYATVDLGDNQPLVQRMLFPSADDQGSVAYALDVYGGAPLGARPEPGEPEESTGFALVAYERPAAGGDGVPRHELGQHAHDSLQPLIGFMDKLLPTFNNWSAQTRALTDAQRQAYVWHCVPDEQSASHARPHSGRLRMTASSYRPDFQLGSTSNQGATPRRLDLEVESELEWGYRSEQTSWLALGALLMVAWTLLVRAVLRRAFLFDLVVSARSRSLGADEAGWWLVLREPEAAAVAKARAREALLLLPAEFRDGTALEKLRAAHARAPEHPVVLLGFDEGLEQPEVATRQLELLEELRRLERQDVRLHALIDPLHLLTSRLRDAEIDDEERARRTSELGRWATALEPFDLVRDDGGMIHVEQAVRAYQEELDAEDRERGGKELRALVRDECFGSASLRHVGGRVLADLAESATPDTNQRGAVVERVLGYAEPSYRRLWSLCSRNEQAVLFRLATEGFVSWQQADTLTRLLRRGLVVLGPAPRLLNESLRRFVIGAGNADQVADWEREVGPTGWRRLRGPLMVGLLLLAAIFFMTQREAFNQFLAIGAALTASGPLLVRLVGLVADPKASAAGRR